MKISRFEMAAIGAYGYLVFIFIVFQYGFWLYRLSPYLWNVYDAEIISSESYVYKEEGQLGNTVQIREKFSMGNLLHGCFPIAPSEGKGKGIKIAVNKYHSDIVIRIDWVPLSKGLRFTNFIMSFIAVIQSIEWVMKMIKKKRKENTIIISHTDST